MCSYCREMREKREKAMCKAHAKAMAEAEVKVEHWPGLGEVFVIDLDDDDWPKRPDPLKSAPYIK